MDGIVVIPSHAVIKTLLIAYVAGDVRKRIFFHDCAERARVVYFLDEFDVLRDILMDRTGSDAGCDDAIEALEF